VCCNSQHTLRLARQTARSLGMQKYLSEPHPWPVMGDVRSEVLPISRTATKLAVTAAAALTCSSCLLWSSQPLPCCHSRLTRTFRTSVSAMITMTAMPMIVAASWWLLMHQMLQLGPTKLCCGSMPRDSMRRLQLCRRFQQSLVEACNAGFKLFQGHEILPRASFSS